MKSLQWLGFIMILLLAACRPAAPTPTAEPEIVETAALETPTQAPATATRALPTVEEPPVTQEVTTEEAYPEPVYTTPQSTIDPTLLAYPDPSEAIPWEQARSLILEGQVSQVTQFHSLRVILVLEDGRTLETVEPQIDAVLEAVEECGDLCEGIQVISE